MDEEDKIVDKQYNCIKDFNIQLYEEDGFPLDEHKTVTIGSVWCEDKETNIIGGEIHLDCFETLDWIEITRDRLSECFKEV